MPRHARRKPAPVTVTHVLPDLAAPLRRTALRLAGGKPERIKVLSRGRCVVTDPDTRVLAELTAP